MNHNKKENLLVIIHLIRCRNNSNVPMHYINHNIPIYLVSRDFFLSKCHSNHYLKSITNIRNKKEKK